MHPTKLTIMDEKQNLQQKTKLCIKERIKRAKLFVVKVQHS